jgi:hypothetical protein
MLCKHRGSCLDSGATRILRWNFLNYQQLLRIATQLMAQQPHHVNVIYVLSSVTGFFLPPSLLAKRPARNLIPASGSASEDQDQTSIFWHSVKHAETNKTL